MPMLVGLLALLLAVPLSIAANLLTPVVRNWYAASSKKRLARRISELEKQLTDLDSREPVEEILKALGYALLSMTCVGFGLMLQVGSELLGPIDVRGGPTLLANFTVYILFGLATVFAVKGAGRMGQRRKQHRAYLEKTITSLKGKLEARSRRDLSS